MWNVTIVHSAASMHAELVEATVQRNGRLSGLSVSRRQRKHREAGHGLVHDTVREGGVDGTDEKGRRARICF